MCTCQTCGKKYKVDILVPDDIWLEIRPDKSRPTEAGMMCGKCIMKGIEALDEYNAFELIRG